jgi:DNA-binding transcriptional MerR regulator
VYVVLFYYSGMFQGLKEQKEAEIRISEVARRLGVTTIYLRLLERQGRIPPARRDPAGRLYSETDIALLRALGVGAHPAKLKDVNELFGARR